MSVEPSFDFKTERYNPEKVDLYADNFRKHQVGQWQDRAQRYHRSEGSWFGAGATAFSVGSILAVPNYRFEKTYKMIPTTKGLVIGTVGMLVFSTAMTVRAWFRRYEALDQARLWENKTAPAQSDQ